MGEVVHLVRAGQPDAVERAWEAYAPAMQKAQAKPNIENMRAAVEAYDRWLGLFLGDDAVSGGPAA